jgi:hypothetical protein
MKHFYLLFCFIATLQLSAQNYVPDPNFNTDGYDVTNYFQNEYNEQLTKNVLVLTDRYVITQDTQLIGYTKSGTIDASFGTQGYIQLELFNTKLKIANSKVIGNSIYVFGSTKDESIDKFYGFIIKLHLNGNYDNQFGANGRLIHELGSITANDLKSDGFVDLVEKDNYIYAVGTAVDETT